MGRAVTVEVALELTLHAPPFVTSLANDVRACLFNAVFVLPANFLYIFVIIHHLFTALIQSKDV